MTDRQKQPTRASEGLPSPPEVPLFKTALINSALISAGLLSSCGKPPPPVTKKPPEPLHKSDEEMPKRAPPILPGEEIDLYLPPMPRQLDEPPPDEPPPPPKPPLDKAQNKGRLPPLPVMGDLFK